MSGWSLRRQACRAGGSTLQEEETDTRRDRRKRQATGVDDPVGLDGKQIQYCAGEISLSVLCNVSKVQTDIYSDDVLCGTLSKSS